MNQELKDRIAKVYELVNNGGTEGERAAAKKALDRIMKKYDLDDSILGEIGYKKYVFKYSKAIELILLNRIMDMMCPYAVDRSFRHPSRKSIVSELQYGDWVTLDCAYEYFRRHMLKEYKRLVLPELKKKRKAKTKSKRRAQLTDLFISRYIIASKLYKEGELEAVDTSAMSEQEMTDRLALLKVEGGNYNKQVIGGLLLES